MFSLTYVSSANRRYTPEELARLAALSTRNNDATGITGVLLYRDGNFIQVLEGAELAVRKLYEVIRCDTRHRGLIGLVQGEVPQRRFPDWSMRLEIIKQPSFAARPADDAPASLFDDPSFSSDLSPAQKLLKSFAERK